MIKVLFICHGNICRSTMAQSVFQNQVNEMGLSDLFEIESAAASREEIGNTPHYGTVGKLRSLGIPLVPHRAIQMTPSDYDYYDFIIGMDSWNMKNIQRIAGGDPDKKIFKLLDFAGENRDIADPWYTGNFDDTYDDIVAGLDGFMDYLKDKNLI